MADNLSHIIARQIVQARERRGWNQVDLANATNIPQGTLSRYENGERIGIHPSNLIRIADATGVSVDFLLGRTETSGTFERIKRARGLTQMTQHHLADALHVSLDDVQSFESPGGREPDLDTLAEIARATGVSLRFLAGREN
jgi:transcriptional regulator with XRE-family HTH domain